MTETEARSKLLSVLWHRQIDILTTVVNKLKVSELSMYIADTKPSTVCNNLSVGGKVFFEFSYICGKVEAN